MTISPAPRFPERAPQVYEMKGAGNATRRGPLRFEEGIAAETMAERAHVGSASWVEAPTFLGEFAHGTMNDYSAATIETVVRSGGRTQRQSATVVND